MREKEIRRFQISGSRLMRGFWALLEFSCVFPFLLSICLSFSLAHSSPFAPLSYRFPARPPPCTAVWPPPVLSAVARLFCDYRAGGPKCKHDVNGSPTQPSDGTPRLPLDWWHIHQAVQTHWHLSCFVFSDLVAGFGCWCLPPHKNTKKNLAISHIFHIIVW